MCGIFAIINQKEEPFDYQSFCTLGAANDRRGGDSCGIFIDGKVEYGIGNKSLFEDFFWSSELLNNTEKARFALGHDRKASVGGISLDKAHPIIITEPVEVAEGEEPREEIKFVMVHNGTLYNYEDLAKKYIPEVDITGMSDSQVIARLLYYAGFDWLAEYNGGAAFIAIDYRNEEPKVLIWRGESKKFSTDVKMEEERPLFCNTDNGRLVISSIPSYLAIVDNDCYIVPRNTVLTYRDGKLYKVKEIDRSKAQQNKKYEYNYQNNNYSRGNNNWGANQVSKFLRTILTTNTYKVGDTVPHDALRITSWGKILNKYDQTGETPHDVYFFDGIALMERKAYMFLNKAQKRSKLDLATFCSMYQNMIRYFSVDQLYYDGVLLYKAITPWTRELYTGYLQQLTEATAHHFLAGVSQNDFTTSTMEESFKSFKNVPTYDYKTIWKEFIQSMG